MSPWGSLLITGETLGPEGPSWCSAVQPGWGAMQSECSCSFSLWMWCCSDSVVQGGASASSPQLWDFRSGVLSVDSCHRSSSEGNRCWEWLCCHLDGIIPEVPFSREHLCGFCPFPVGVAYLRSLSLLQDFLNLHFRSSEYHLLFTFLGEVFLSPPLASTSVLTQACFLQALSAQRFASPLLSH